MKRLSLLILAVCLIGCGAAYQGDVTTDVLARQATATNIIFGHAILSLQEQIDSLGVEIAATGGQR